MARGQLTDKARRLLELATNAFSVRGKDRQVVRVHPDHVRSRPFRGSLIIRQSPGLASVRRFLRVPTNATAGQPASASCAAYWSAASPGTPVRRSAWGASEAAVIGGTTTRLRRSQLPPPRSHR